MGLLALTAACEKPESATRSEPVGETIQVAPAPRATAPAEPPRPAAMPPPAESSALDLPRPINPRELPAPVPMRRKATWYSQLTAEQKRDVREVCAIKKEDPCAGLLPMPVERVDGERVARRSRPRVSELMEKFAEVDQDRTMQWCHDNVGVGACDTPIVIAYETGAPVALVPANGDTFAFKPGAAPSATAWPTAATPWLALDRDGDGAITGGAELFGDAVAEHGFAALAQLDANHDGAIDARDPMFAALLLWTDRDGDRASTPAELAPAALTITSISLAYQTGAAEGPRAHVTLRDGRDGAAIDLYLRSR